VPEPVAFHRAAQSQAATRIIRSIRQIGRRCCLATLPVPHAQKALVGEVQEASVAQVREAPVAQVREAPVTQVREAPVTQVRKTPAEV
jgi:hypothetical protein